MSKLSKRQVLMDGLRLKCPRCREGDLFADLFKMESIHTKIDKAIF